MKYVYILSWLFICSVMHAQDDERKKDIVTWRQVDRYVDDVTRWSSYKEMYDIGRSEGFSESAWDKLMPYYKTQVYTAAGLVAMSLLSPKKAVGRMSVFAAFIGGYKFGRDASR